MRKDFYKLSDREIEETLYPKILLTIENAKKAGYFRLFGFWTALSLISSPVVFILLNGLHRKLIESSTYEYISLLINDADARSHYAKDILFAVYDTIPVMGASITLLAFVLVIVFYYKAMQSLSLLAMKRQVVY